MFDQIIPFDSWDGKTDLTSPYEQEELEKFLGAGAVAFNSCQNAVAAVLEVLGTRTSIIPVVLPITAAPDTVAGVLRGGADPILLDIDASTLQIDPVALKEVLDEVKAAVVILTRPGGSNVDSRLLDLTKGLPTILDTKSYPGIYIGHRQLATFVIHDLETVIGSGAIVRHQYTDQLRELKMVRSGVLGLGANLNPLLAKAAHNRLTYEAMNRDVRREKQRTVANAYMKKLKPYLKAVQEDWPYFITEVGNADKVMVHLRTYGISAVKPVFPLHYLSEMNRRWQEAPSYPVAEELHKKLIALPTHPGILDEVDMIVEKLLEVAE